MAGESTETKLVLQIEANIKSLERSLKQAGLLEKQLTTEIQKDFTKTGDVIDQQSQQISRSMRQTQQATQNLSFQFNDIAQGLLSGTSPFTIMIQQSGQAAQAIEGLGKGNVLKGIGSALSSFFSPASLGISALILGFGALAQVAGDFFSESTKEAKDLNEELLKQVGILNDIREQQGLTPVSTDNKSSVEIFIAMRDAIAKSDETAKSLADTLNELQGEILGIPVDEFEGQTYVIQQLDSELSKLQQGIKRGDADFEAFARRMAEIEKIPLPEEIKELVKQVIDLSAKAALSAENLEKLKAAMLGVNDGVRELNASMIQFQPLSPITSDMIQTNEFSQRVNEFRRLAGEAKGITADFIKDREQFRTHAYWDVNAWRVGFGSDTYVDSMGNIQKVTEQTVVTLDQANADLARRIAEFQRGIIGVIGPDIWRSLDEKQQTALTSIAYNYGSLPKRIATAIKAGDRGQVAQAIADLGGDNKGVNRGRRQMEAELYGGGSYDAKKKSIDDLILSEQQQVALQTQINEINANAALTDEQQQFAIDKLTASTKLLNQAKQEGIALTDEVRAKIEQQATAYATAEQAQRQLALTQKDSVTAAKELAQAQEQLGQQYANIAKSALSGFINDLRNGVEAGEAFRNMLNRVIDGLINMTIEALFSKNALGGVFANLFGGGGGLGVGLYHRGTGGGTRDVRNVSPAMFAAAPRLHSGLQPGEFPAILQAGEKVVPRSVVRRGGNGNGGNTYLGDVKVDVSTGMVTASNEDARDLGRQIDTAVQAVLVRESRPGGLLRQAGGR